MKKIISTLFILIFSVTLTLADGMSSETVKQMDILKKELNLTDVQYDRIGRTIDYLVLEELKIKKVLKDSPDAMNARLDEVRRIKIQNLKGGLTKEQISNFDRKELEDKL